MKETKAEKKEQILNAAERLFSEHGFDATSTRSIANEAEVNMAMLNYYFGSKDGLFRAVIERRFTGFRERLFHINEENISPKEKVNLFIDLYVDKLMSNNCFHRLMNREVSLLQRSEMSEFITDNILKNTLKIKEIIQDGIKSGEFRQVDVELTVASMIGTSYYIINSTQLSSKLLQKDLTDQSIIDNEVKPRVKKHLKDLLDTHLKRI